MNEEEKAAIPDILTKPLVVDGNLWLPGVGPKHASIMFIGLCPSFDEISTERKINAYKSTSKEPRLLDCGYGVLFKKIALRNGIDIEKCYYTTILKHMPSNKAHQKKPPKKLIQDSIQLVYNEINLIRPDIVVCLGKPVFDQFTNIRATESDIYATWFDNKKLGINRLYCMPSIEKILLNPELIERFTEDFKSIRAVKDSLSGLSVPTLPVNSRVIRNSTELRDLVNTLRNSLSFILSVDCEWHGRTFVDGKLRSMQIAWSETDAAYIRFMDDKLNYAFDVSYEEAGAILGEWLNNPNVRYIGHHISADLVWMHHWLKLDWYDKAIFDCEFALQCVDEANKLGLEHVSIKYTTCGRYDWDLLWWCKQHKDLVEDGYGLIPDELLIPYGILDVIVPYRAYPKIYAQLERQSPKLVDYYNKICNPFVTNVFTEFCMNGLPMNTNKMDHMRDLYNWAKCELEKEFLKLMVAEAEELLSEKCIELLGDREGEELYEIVKDYVIAGEHDNARSKLMQAAGPERMLEVGRLLDHYILAPSFNIRSKPQMTTWLFDIKHYTPVKSTKNPALGMPSVSWQKILTYPEERQKTFTPASDANTLNILASKHDDKVIKSLLELNAVGNICKSFLKPADVDPDTGEVVGENGLHYWLASDNRIHLNSSMTETGSVTAP